MLECESFLSYVFKDACFPPKCDDNVELGSRYPPPISSFFPRSWFYLL